MVLLSCVLNDFQLAAKQGAKELQWKVSQQHADHERSTYSLQTRVEAAERKVLEV